jgi:hypothetical protein
MTEQYALATNEIHQNPGQIGNQVKRQIRTSSMQITESWTVSNNAALAATLK